MHLTPFLRVHQHTVPAYLPTYLKRAIGRSPGVGIAEGALQGFKTWVKSVPHWHGLIQRLAEEKGLNTRGSGVWRRLGLF